MTLRYINFAIVILSRINNGLHCIFGPRPQGVDKWAVKSGKSLFILRLGWVTFRTKVCSMGHIATLTDFTGSLGRTMRKLRIAPQQALRIDVVAAKPVLRREDVAEMLELSPGPMVGEKLRKTAGEVAEVAKMHELRQVLRTGTR